VSIDEIADDEDDILSIQAMLPSAQAVEAYFESGSTAKTTSGDLDGYTSHSNSNTLGDRKAGGKTSIDTTWLGDDTIDLVAKTVEDFRRQRVSMVQSLRQFVLCYETVIEWVWRLGEYNNPTVGASTIPRSRSRRCSLDVMR
jgi:hypothetical protein